MLTGKDPPLCGVTGAVPTGGPPGRYLKSADNEPQNTPVSINIQGVHPWSLTARPRAKWWLEDKPFPYLNFCNFSGAIMSNFGRVSFRLAISINLELDNCCWTLALVCGATSPIQPGTCLVWLLVPLVQWHWCTPLRGPGREGAMYS